MRAEGRKASKPWVALEAKWKWEQRRSRIVIRKTAARITKRIGERNEQSKPRDKE